MKLIGFGDCCVDYYIQKKLAFPGGNAFNVSVYANDNGIETAFLGTIGDDLIGDHILKCAKLKGVDISHCPIKHGDSGRAAVNIVNGDRFFEENYFNGKHGVGTLYPPMLSEIDLRYIEGFDLVHSSCYAQVEDQLKRLRLDDLLVSFDFSSEERFRTNEYLSQICPMVDLALFSCEGMKKKELLNFAQRVQKFGCKNVLMTMGKYGQTLLTNEGRLYEGKAKLVKAIDTMGAGDSFFSAFIATLLNEGWKKNKSLSDKEVYDAFSAASAYSARICMVEGSFGMGLPIEFTEP